MTVLDDKQVLARRQAQAQSDAHARLQGGHSTASLAPTEQSEESLVTDGFIIPDLEVPAEAPPAYGEHVDRVTFSQPGFQAGAAVTGMKFKTPSQPIPSLLY